MQHCWIFHVGSVCTPGCMLLCVVWSCCAKFETGQNFSHVQTDATAHNIVAPTMLGVVASVCTWLNLRSIRLHFLCSFSLHTLAHLPHFSHVANSRQKRLLRLPPRLLDPYMSQLFFRLQLFYFEAGFHCEHFSFIVFPTLFCEALLIRPLVATLWTLSIKEDHIAELLLISRKESRRGSWSLIPHSRSFFHEYPASRIPHPAFLYPLSWILFFVFVVWFEIRICFWNM